MRFFITDLKRGLTERTFWGALLLTTMTLILPFVYFLSNEQITGAEELFKQSHSLILPFIAPLIAGMSYANMNMLEKDCGFERLLLMKAGIKSYRMRRMIVVGIVSALSIGLPVVLLALLCLVKGSYDNTYFIVQTVMLSFMFGFVYGNVAYGLTFLNDKRYIPTITPQVVYLLFIYAFPYLGLERYYPPLAISPWVLGGNIVIENSLVQLAVLSVLSILCVLGTSGWEKAKTAFEQMRGGRDD